jgi:hypothetical protein
MLLNVATLRFHARRWPDSVIWMPRLLPTLRFAFVSPEARFHEKLRVLNNRFATSLSPDCDRRKCRWKIASRAVRAAAIDGGEDRPRARALHTHRHRGEHFGRRSVRTTHAQREFLVGAVSDTAVAADHNNRSNIGAVCRRSPRDQHHTPQAVRLRARFGEMSEATCGYEARERIEEVGDASCLCQRRALMLRRERREHRQSARSNSGSRGAKTLCWTVLTRNHSGARSARSVQ